MSRVLVISGAASGLGAALATQARTRGWTTVGLDRRPSTDCDVHRVVDITDDAAVAAALAECAGEVGGFSAVATCAGIDVPGDFDEVDAAAWTTVIAVNLIGTASVVRATLAHASGTAHVLTVASTLGLRGAGGATAYCASKFGVVGFTRALAAEMRDRHAVTLVIPGGMQTTFFDGREERFRPGPDTPLADPKDVADVMLDVLDRPATAAVRELVVTPLAEGSWP